MTNSLTPAARLWLELFPVLFSRSRQPKLWEAMAKLSITDQRRIDDAVVAIIEQFLQTEKAHDR